MILTADECLKEMEKFADTHELAQFIQDVINNTEDVQAKEKLAHVHMNLLGLYGLAKSMRHHLAVLKLDK